MQIINLVEQNKEDSRNAKKLVDLINPLIEEAFGPDFKGNYGLFQGQYISFHHPCSELAHIARKKTKRNFWKFFIDPEGLEIVGNFYFDSSGSRLKPHERDGSVITVKPEYEPLAKRYADLYRARFEKDIVIRVANIVDREIYSFV